MSDSALEETNKHRIPKSTESLGLCMMVSLVEVKEDKRGECRRKGLKGGIVSSLTQMKNMACFVFPDLGVGMAGQYRYNMELFQVTE